MLRMLFTSSNRYEIKSEDLNIFLKKVKEGFIEVEVNGEKFITDTYSYYLPSEFEDMLAGRIFPFPEHVSLLNKKGLKDIDLSLAKLEIEDSLRRPRVKTPVYE